MLLFSSVVVFSFFFLYFLKNICVHLTAEVAAVELVTGGATVVTHFRVIITPSGPKIGRLL